MLCYPPNFNVVTPGQSPIRAVYPPPQGRNDGPADHPKNQKFNPVNCQHCHDTRICQICHGQGIDLDVGYGLCPVCDGSGKCSYCSTEEA